MPIQISTKVVKNDKIVLNISIRSTTIHSTEKNILFEISSKRNCTINN